jgi:hypothetical protein
MREYNMAMINHKPATTKNTVARISIVRAVSDDDMLFAEEE